MNRIEKIADKLSEEALIEQLVEECGELVQALAKRLRILRGENFTPVSKESNFDNLTEELADVSLCMNVLNMKIDVDRKYFDSITEIKKERWLKRLGE